MFNTPLNEINPIWLAFFGGLFTWGITALGAATVFLTKTVDKKMLSTMLGFAAGVMIAASFWSLLSPSIEMAKEMNMPGWLPACTGFMAGCGFFRLIDMFLPHLHMDQPIEKAEGVKTNWNKVTLLVLAITIHNIPEGLAVGVAFGAIGAGLPSADITAAIALAIGIGIQDFPEGLAVSMPLRAAGLSKWQSFWVGQLSGFVEVIAAVIGAVAVVFIKPLLPFALAFAAGAMIFVVIEELIPEAQSGDHSDIATMGFVIGFTIMMFLDVALG